MTTPENKPKADKPEAKAETTTGKVTLATPAFLDEFKVGDITITPAGKELSQADAEKVREAAKPSRVKLREL